VYVSGPAPADPQAKDAAICGYRVGRSSIDGRWGR
jgi:hypothetical protein